MTVHVDGLMRTLELSDDVVIYIFAQPDGEVVAAYDGKNAYELAKAAHHAGHEDHDFLRRWIAASERQTEKHGPRPQTSTEHNTQKKNRPEKPWEGVMKEVDMPRIKTL